MSMREVMKDILAQAAEKKNRSRRKAGSRCRCKAPG